MSVAVANSVAIVTGGSRGIGAAIVERLARRGHTVLSVYRSEEGAAAEIERSSSALRSSVASLRCDLTVDDAPARILDVARELGDVTVVVNNAGITGPIGPLTSATDETLRAVLEVNLTATMRLSREVVSRWEAEGTGPARCIVNVSSIAARTGAPGEYIWYAASKAGVEAFTVGLAREVASFGIRVNCVSPGTTATTIHERAGRPTRATEVGALSPLGRAATADEIAAAVEWLTTTDSSYVTGTILDVAGGNR